MERETLQQLLERTFGPRPATSSRLSQISKPSEEQTPSFFLMLLVVGLLAATAVSWVVSHDLSEKNKALTAESEKLQRSVDRLLATEKVNGELRQTLEIVRAENENLKKKFQETETGLSRVSAEKTRLLEDLQVYKKAGRSRVPLEMALQIREKDAQIAKLTDQNRALTRKMGRLYKTVNEKISTIHVARLALEETITDARKKIDEEWSTVDLGTVTAGGASAKGGSASGGKKEGRVLAVNEDHGFVIIDLGKADGLKNDASLSLMKDGQTIADLKVIEMRDVMSACNLRNLAPESKAAVNDRVVRNNP